MPKSNIITLLLKLSPLSKKRKKAYDDQKKNKFTEDTFDAWIPMNYPQFLGAYHTYNQKRAEFLNAFMRYDEAKAGEWDKKFGDLWNQWHFGSFDNGKEKGSNLIIITDEDVDNYDVIVEKQRKQISERMAAEHGH
ncbi:hypothetical protein N7481_011221 [Penicillium waksmanii]|uniref:uncharacterized protein n=1 Tax=Penicillium waksmanii TaxID=69791 RepID=UPI002548A804|nr:uncharacterized protein N7481_011221 [Penicillium waksmanii]KAJ5974011.1 hypothetical protein N7481_011221 [Penicillium waksmanii]